MAKYSIKNRNGKKSIKKIKIKKSPIESPSINNIWRDVPSESDVSNTMSLSPSLHPSSLPVSPILRTVLSNESLNTPVQNQLLITTLPRSTVERMETAEKQQYIRDGLYTINYIHNPFGLSGKKVSFPVNATHDFSKISFINRTLVSMGYKGANIKHVRGGLNRKTRRKKCNKKRRKTRTRH